MPEAAPGPETDARVPTEVNPRRRAAPRGWQLRFLSAFAGLGLAAAALPAAWLVLELGLRLTGGGASVLWQATDLHQPDPHLIYSLRRDLDRGDVHTSPTGLRGPPVRPRREVSLRVVALGDSFTFGAWVQDDEAYPRRLERRLQLRGLAAEVLNGGVAGYGTDQAFELFRTRLAPLEPDLVVWAWYWNDPEDNLRQPLFDLGPEGDLVPVPATRSPVYTFGALTQLLPEAVRGLRSYQFLGHHMIRIGVERQHRDRAPDERMAWARRKAVRQLELLRAFGEERGFRLLLVLLPSRERPASTWDWFRAPEGVAVLDLARAPEWGEREAEYFLDWDLHLSPRGNDRLAERVAGELDRRGWLRPRE